MTEIEKTTSTREIEIIDSAHEVFLEYGYKKTTMDDVAARLNITRSALYYYYRNKDDLFLAIMENAFRDYKEKIDNALADKSTTAEKFDVYCEHYLSHREIFFRMYKFNDDDFPALFDLHKRIKTMTSALQSRIISDIFKSDKKY